LGRCQGFDNRGRGTRDGSHPLLLGLRGRLQTSGPVLAPSSGRRLPRGRILG
jgi:hypothetical protein